MKGMLKPFVLLVAILVVDGCRAKGPGPTSPHQQLDATATALREAFNADAGKVRIVMLVSPT